MRKLRHVGRQFVIKSKYMLIEIVLVMPASKLVACLPGSIGSRFILGAAEKTLVGGILATRSSNGATKYDYRLTSLL